MSQALPAIVDVHCHCLPGVDDGPADMAEALDLGRMLVAEGVVTVVASPHQLGRYERINDAAAVRNAVAGLQRRLQGEGIPLMVLAGGDVRVQEDLVEQWQRGGVLTVGDAEKWMLLEMPEAMPLDITPVLEGLARQGIRAVLTHPERYSWIDGVFKRVVRWRNSHGMLLQVTAGSLLGHFGPEASRRAWEWLENGLVDIVASDAHDTVKRPPRLVEAWQAVSRRCGERVALRVLQTVPGSVVAKREAGTADGRRVVTGAVRAKEGKPAPRPDVAASGGGRGRPRWAGQRGTMEPYNWIILVFFAAALAACGVAAVASYRLRRNEAGLREPVIWSMIALMFACFIALKAERAIGQIASLARNEARIEGVYADRRMWQMGLVVGAGLLWVGQIAYFGKYLAHRWKRYRWPLLGSGAIICFGVIRAVSLHEIDAMGWLMSAKLVVEVAAALAVSWGAMVRRRQLGRNAGRSDMESRTPSAPDDVSAKAGR